MHTRNSRFVKQWFCLIFSFIECERWLADWFCHFVSWQFCLIDHTSQPVSQTIVFNVFRGSVVINLCSLFLSLSLASVCLYLLEWLWQKRHITFAWGSHLTYNFCLRQPPADLRAWKAVSQFSENVRLFSQCIVTSLLNGVPQSLQAHVATR